MCFHNTIVIEADSLTEGILGDFKASIDIAPERRGEIKADREGEGFRLKPMHQRSFVGGLRQGQPELLPDMLLIGSTGRRQDPAALDRGVLMVDAGGNRQRDLDEFGSHDCRGRRDMKRRSGTGLSNGWAQVCNGRLLRRRFRFGARSIGDDANGDF
jgi:hypothetical protein